MSANGNDREARVPHGFGLTGPSDSVGKLLEWIDRAVRHGFDEVQLQILWNPIREKELTRIAQALRATGLRCRSIGVYSDLMLPESNHFFNTTERELRQVIEWMGEVQAESVVAWCGSYNDDLLGADPRNTSAETRMRLADNLDALLPLLEKHGVRLLVEPWVTHVLQTEDELADFCAARPDTTGVVIDVANLIKPADWTKRNERIASIVDRLSPICGLVHLKDMKVAADGSFELPYCGLGEIDFSLVLSKLKPLWRKVPFLVEHVKSDEDIARATAEVLAMAKKAGYDLT